MMRLKDLASRRFLAVGVVFGGLVPCLLIAGEPKKDDATRSPEGALAVADLKWLSGEWNGRMFGGPIREQWHAPEGGVMIGTSVMGLARERAMYELMVIEERDGVPTMFLRHFKQYLATSETEPMAFQLKSVEGRKAVFETSDTRLSYSRLVYERVEKNELVVRLEGVRDGKPVSVESRMKRAGE